ncbi:MAG: P-loop NTPase, partial [Desulfobacterales bacterium]
CKRVKMDVFGLIENMSGLSCPHCGEIIDLFGSGGGEKTARQFGLNFLGRIPIDPNIVQCGDSGQCYRDANIDSNVTRAFDEIAGKMAELSRKN